MANAERAVAKSPLTQPDLLGTIAYHTRTDGRIAVIIINPCPTTMHIAISSGFGVWS